MSLNIDLANSPKSIRPSLWVLSTAVALCGLGAFGLSAIESKAQAAALAQSAPLAERIAQLEGGQKQLWTTINDKLDKITLDVAQTSKDVAVLSQRVNDNDAHSTQRDNDRRK